MNLAHFAFYTIVLLVLIDQIDSTPMSRRDQRMSYNRLMQQRIQERRVQMADAMMNSEEEMTLPVQTEMDSLANSASNEMDSSSEMKACCPVIKQMTSPRGARNQNGKYVELYHGSVPQQFFETRCDPDTVDKPCRFLKHPKYASTCTQEYSYVYALIKSENGSSQVPWTLDYIQIPSGCSCQVSRR